MRDTVWQVPETCGWNPFVQDLADGLKHVGWAVLTPGVCRDECEPVPGATPQWSGRIPDVVHMAMKAIYNPVYAPATAGRPFDFGAHANDFLVGREQSCATETFLVRVPGGGAVPEHEHPDMEQTFVFLSGVGIAALSVKLV